LRAHPIRTGQAVWSSQLAAAGLAALFLLVTASGCHGPDRPARTAQSVPPTPTPGYLDPERLLALHPDAPELVDLDRRIQRARKFPTPLRTPSLQSPEPLILATPETLPQAKPVSREVDAARARAAVEEDFNIRRLARPEEEEQRYRRALERLRRRFLELRLEPRPIDDNEDLAEALRNARRYSELEEQLRSLRERPEDRLFYTPAQLSRRRELYRLTQQEQEALRQAEMTRLEQALDPSGSRGRNLPKQERQIPPEELARVEQERDARRQQALEALAKLEQSTLEAAVHTELPPAGPLPDPAPAALPEEELAGDRELAASKTAKSAQAKVTLPSASAAASAASSLVALQRTREELREHLLEETKAAALVAARSHGINATFTRGAAPDRTAQLAPDVVRVLSGRVRKGAR
jgi:hypothetical protein